MVAIKHNETKEQRMFIAWIESQYPKLNYYVDLYSFMQKIQRFAANLMRKKNMPDIKICKPTKKYHGLFIEMKQTGAELYNKNGTIKSKYKDQKDKLNELISDGYYATFALGFEHAKEILINYLKSDK